MIHEAIGTQNIKVTNNTRTIRWRWRVNFIYNYNVKTITWWTKIYVCLCRVVSCKACSFTVFCQKKILKKKRERKKEREWIRDELISQVQVPSVFYSEIPCTTVCWFFVALKNPLNVINTNSFSWESNFTSPTTTCRNLLVERKWIR